jgi:hypothetical protein
MALIIVDCEGINVLTHEMRCFGAVEFESRESFYGEDNSKETFERFRDWLSRFKDGRLTIVSDNVAYDWQGINYGFLKHLGENPFGWSGRRIGDFAAGLVGDFFAKQVWKELRETKHTHHPVDDAMGNVEALHRLIQLSALDKLRKGSDRWQRDEDGKWRYRVATAVKDSPDHFSFGTE